MVFILLHQSYLLVLIYYAPVNNCEMARMEAVVVTRLQFLALE